MKLPRDIAGRDLVQALCRDWGYRVEHQVGSHIVLDTESPSHHRVTVPGHSPLRIGTLNSILRAVSRHKGVTRDALLDSL